MKTDFENRLGVVNAEEVDSIIKELELLDLEAVPFSVVKRKVRKLIKVGFMCATFPALDKRILRGRVWDPQEREHAYTRVSEISYPPAIDPPKLNFNRASSGQVSVFYGAVRDDESSQAHVVAMVEVDDFDPKTFPEDSYKQVVIGDWFAKQGFMIAALGLHSELARNKIHVKTMIDFQNEACEELPIRGPLIQRVSRFMSKEFSKKVKYPWQYKISAAYGDALFELGIPAIVFPSIKADGNCFNIAIRSDVVDRCLEIETAAVSRIQNISGHIVGDWILECPRVYGNRLTWSPPVEGYISMAEKALIKKLIVEGNWDIKQTT